MSTYGPPPAQPFTDQRRGAARAASATNAWIWAIVTLGYLLPWAIAASRGVRNSGSIFLINLLTGWTFIGWFVALVMACSRHQMLPQQVVVAQPAQPGYGYPAQPLPPGYAQPGTQPLPPAYGQQHPAPAPQQRQPF